MDSAVKRAAPALLDLPVRGGDLRVAVWEAEPGAPTALLIHGVTSSHLAWSWVAEQLPGVRLIAPDLRGRGRSAGVAGPAGMIAHADDLAAVLAAVGVDRTLVVGHSMGGFVALVFAQRHPERVSELVLVDGGIPLEVPAGMTPEETVAHVLGPTGERLSMRFATTDDYLGFWHAHPAFDGPWSPLLDEYFAYDLVDDGAGALRPATRFETVAEDNVDMTTTTVVPDALAALAHDARLLTVPRGLAAEPPGLYSPERLAQVLPQHPRIHHERIDGFNHYTIVMTDAGAAVVSRAVLDALEDAS
ncbi:alpha/beta fold hydrolase [Microbacterium sp. ASV49]|uniref:Alpha/beta hydrolase n=1 Tax=Microbacterium candidum TaxID=3041922 RepID=A0ABT7N098_9MICO|nr:alpha/beta hydrolase [Microbacterium sp. ASV49]MDL9980135.1 alpha/beta hydrolase [Microbacterium sp. ASV49]